MPRQCSHPSAAPPSTLLALLAASIVRDHEPTWLARPVAEFARESDVRPERVSRLKRKLFDHFRILVEKASRRGRPRRRRPSPCVRVVAAWPWGIRGAPAKAKPWLGTDPLPARRAGAPMGAKF